MTAHRIQMLVIIALIPVGLMYWFSNANNVPIKDIFLPGTPVMHIDENALRVEIANSEEERKRGLSGRSNLEKGTGMLFVFPENGYHGMWMKDMYFPIDIIWINEDLVIVGVEKNVSPNTYPRTFRPLEPVRYVVETIDRYVETFGIRAGNKVRLPVNYLEN